MKNKPYGVKVDRLWLGARVSIFDPKIGEPYASQIEREIDEYISYAILQARSQAYEECAKIAETVRHDHETPHWLAGTCAAADAIRSKANQ